MSITSLTFILFITALILVYYLLPKRFQWVVLLVFSGCFYLTFGAKNALYVLFTASSIYGATRWMQQVTDSQKAFLKENKATLTKEEKAELKAKNKARRKRVMLITLLVNLAFLCTFKYLHFAISTLDSILTALGTQGIEDKTHLIAPLGISFYTFQAVGYLVDVYWENIRAEKNYFKVLLFVSFFPQITQGPISEYEQLSKELFIEHEFTYKNYSWGAQRMLWGFFKKMVVANTLGTCVNKVFANYLSYSGITTFLGALAYSAQIYADFSGYMDIMCGFCEILGIHLTENFERPYFSKSIAEYWRRWHISLGAWFKRYIYFPIGMSTWNRKLAKSTREKFGKHFSDTLPASIALVVVWLATGLWHGASWAYVAWGLVNGLFIILSLWLDPIYASMRQLCRVNESSWCWRAFQTIRTFILVTFIKVLPEVGTLSDGWGLWKHIFTDHTIPHSLRSLLPFVGWSATITTILFFLAVLGVLVMFVVSLLQRRKPVREYLDEMPLVVRVLLFSCIFMIIATFGVQASWDDGGFLYAQF